MADIQRILEHLRTRGFESAYYARGEDVVSYLDRSLDGQIIGFGGSETLRVLGLYPRLSSHNQVFWHWEDEAQRRPAYSAPVYITSANALAESGELVNIDAGGNRVAATSFGPERLIFVVGINKLAPDLDGAIHRARHVAAPQNCVRLHRDTPCARTADRCYDCRSADRLCQVMTVHLGRPLGIPRAEVLLVGEPLGY